MRFKMPKDGTMRTIKRFAYVPTLVKGQEKDTFFRVWLEFYQQNQMYDVVLNTWRSQGWSYITEPREKKE